MPVYDTPLTTNDHSLDRVLQAGMPVVLLVWDSRQGANVTLDDALKQVAKADAGNLLVARLDAADNPAAGARYGTTTPALVLFRDGQPLEESSTPVGAADVRAYADYVLGKGPRPQQAAPQAAPQGNGSAPTRPVAVTDASFQQEVFGSSVPVVVDFWAPWCGPCRMIGPALERIASDMGGRVKIAKVNVDDNQQYAGQYGVRGIPTLLIVKDGKIVDRLVGALPEQALRQRIQAYVN